MYTPNIEQTECASGYFIRARISRLWFGLALQDGFVLAMCTRSTEVRGLRHSKRYIQLCSSTFSDLFVVFL